MDFVILCNILEVVKMDRIRLDSNIDLKVMARLEVLYYFIYELAESFGVEKDVLDSIKTGVLDNHILEQIIIRYKISDGTIVGKIIIAIDWEKHFCLAETDRGKLFEIDMSKSVVENVVDWKKYIVLHTQEIRKQFNVVRIDGEYRYRSQIEKDEKEYNKALKIMNHVIATNSNNESIDVELTEKLTEVIEECGALGSQEIEYDAMDKISPSCRDLEEVTLTIYSKRM